LSGGPQTRIGRAAARGRAADLRGIAVLALAAFALPAGAALYKCQDASGRVTYGDQPCVAGQTLTKEIEAPAPATASGGGSTTAKSAGDAAAAPYRRPQRVEVPPLPPVDLARLPTDAQGRPVLGGSAGSEIVADKQAKRRPVNVLAACSSLVSRCVKPPERTLDACFFSAPRCASAQPWNDPAYTPCCPAECWAGYERQRIAGMAPLAAFDAVLFGGDGDRLERLARRLRPGCLSAGSGARSPRARRRCAGRARGGLPRSGAARPA
jgi:hypothetical protein